MQQQSVITNLKQTCQDLKEKQVATHMEFEREKQSLTVQIQDQKGQYETSKVLLNKPNPIMLKEFDELLLDNILLKMQNQDLGDKNPKWEEWWQFFQEFIEEQIQESMELARYDEQNYQLELHAYQTTFLNFKYIPPQFHIYGDWNQQQSF